MNRINRRGGSSLLELLLVMSVATVILGVNVGWIFQTMKFASKTKQLQQHHQSLTQLAWALRDDVHASGSISMNGNDQLVLKSDRGLQVTYTIAGTEIRVEKSNNQPMVKRERYALAGGSTVAWDTSEMPEWISLKVYRGRGIAESPSDSKTEQLSFDKKSLPVDLHVRVAPNRWAAKTDKRAPSASRKRGGKMKRHSDSTRQGAVLIAVLVCMGFATVVLLGAVQSSLHQRRQLRQDLQLEQTRWMLDAGLTTGLERLRKKPDYDGETISLSAELEKYSDASVEITVTRDAAPDPSTRLRVVARLGQVDQGIPMMKRSREIVVD